MKSYENAINLVQRRYSRFAPATGSHVLLMRRTKIKFDFPILSHFGKYGNIDGIAYWFFKFFISQ